MDEIRVVSELLATPLSDEPQQLIENLIQIEGWYARMLFLLAGANSDLDEYRSESLPAKEGRSELDRKVLLDGATARRRRIRDQVQALCDAIENRIRLGMTILSYQKELNVRAPRGPGEVQMRKGYA